MSKILWQVLKAAPAVLIGSLMVAKGSIAAETTQKFATNNQNSSLIAQAKDSSQLLEQIDRYNQEGREQGQIVNVFQLRDVSPGDWAFEALRSLVERYGCIVGYPDRTFRGNRALSRYEFAAGLNACLNQIERLIAASEAVLREDIDRLQRLIQEFEAELAALGVRVDDLEGRVAFLEDHQFSTTTKLKGEVIIGASVAGGGDKASNGEILALDALGNTILVEGSEFSNLRPTNNPVPPSDLGGRTQNINEAIARLNPALQARLAADPSVNPTGIVDAAGLPALVFADPDPLDDEVVLYQRTRLNLNTSFTGRDKLVTRLESGNVTRFDRATGTDSARLGFDKNNNNNIDLGKLWYQFPIGEKVTVHIGASDVDFDDISDPKNPYFESSGSGALSRFGRRNPAIFRTGGSQSLGVNFEFNDIFGVDLAYLTEGSNDPRDKGGLFNGDYTAAIQLNIDPTENIEIGVAYARSYQPGEEVNLSGSTGTQDAKNPFAYYEPGLGFGTPLDVVGLLTEDIPVSANRFGIQGSVKLGERFNINAWFGYVEGIAEEPSTLVALNQLVPGTFSDTLLDVLDANIEEGDSRGVINGALGIAILDVGKEGSVIGLIAGVPPFAPDTTTQGGSDDVPIFIEGQYRFPITKNILITPGLYTIINPEQNSANDTIFVGTIRTTFKF